MHALSLPFVTAGVILTLKRLRSANLSLWLVLLFFLPVIKVIFFLFLIIIPPREASSGRASALPDLQLWPGLLIPRSHGGAVVAGIALATACSAANVWIGTTLLRNSFPSRPSVKSLVLVQMLGA